MSRLPIALLLSLLLAGCATPRAEPPPAELTVAAPPAEALEAAAEALVAGGYVVRHADASLGRLEAVFSRWPGYRVRVEVEGEGEDSRLRLAASRHDRALPPSTLEALAAQITARVSAGD
ncbi:MAG: hypothetical protein ACLFRS_12490 [Halomonas sp.]